MNMMSRDRLIIQYLHIIWSNDFVGTGKTSIGLEHLSQYAEKTAMFGHSRLVYFNHKRVKFVYHWYI